MSDQHRSSHTVQVQLRVLGRPITVVQSVSEGPTRLDEALPFLRSIADRVIQHAVAHTEATGAKISCRRGCAACCKAQPVPVTPAEAYALLRIVEAMDEPLQKQVRERFADRAARLREAGLAEAFIHYDDSMTAAEARHNAQRYFRLGLVCPFLEDDACSIYRDRPFVCRQYLVTSPADLCQDPFDNPVEPIPIPIGAAGVALETATAMLGKPQITVPLVLALEYAEEHRTELERTFEPEVLYRRSIKALAP